MNECVYVCEQCTEKACRAPFRSTNIRHLIKLTLTQVNRSIWKCVHTICLTCVLLFTSNSDIKALKLKVYACHVNYKIIHFKCQSFNAVTLHLHSHTQTNAIESLLACHSTHFSPCHLPLLLLLPLFSITNISNN